MRHYRSLIVAAVCLATPGLSAQNTAPPAAPSPDALAAYKQLRDLAVGPEAYQVSGFALTADTATFTLTGTLHMLPGVRGKVTGAVFIGQGTMAYTPPLAVERSALGILTRGEPFDERFERAVFRFTDDTAEKMKAASAGPASGSTAQAQDALKDISQTLRLKLRDNLHARILSDVLSPTPGGLFHAYISGKKYSGKLAYMIDPRGVGFVSPEEVQLLSWDDSKGGIYAGHYLSSFYAKKQRAPKNAGTWIDIEHQKLETTIDQSAELSGVATMRFAAMVDGLAAVPLSLFPALRVSSVTDAGGAALAFVQESKEEDADFWVVLPKPLNKGEKFTLRTTYKGKDAVQAEGNDNFFPVARTNWYPNSDGLKDYATYDMTFSVHKRMKLVATGDFVSEAIEGDKSVSRWKSDYPKSVAGFSLGLFKRQEGKVGDYAVIAMANELPSNMISSLRNFPGSLDTASSNKMALTEAQIAMQVFTDYFGPISLTRIHMTQQTACNFGQAWPGVIYIPTCYYWSPAIRQQLGLQQGHAGYWDSVAAHEVGHMWWGHALGWNSYRHQWMSEGFANLSASLYS